jgi:hypothetical protein
MNTKTYLAFYKTLALAIVLLQLFCSGKSFAQGWTSSGGGSGVACFTNKEWALKADEYIAKNRPLDVKLLNKIEKVQALDLFEAAPATKKLIEDQWGSTNPKSENWEDLFHALVYRIKTLAPFFGISLETLEGKMLFANWKPMPTLKNLKDQYKPSDERNSKLGKVISQKYPHCRLIQLALRNSKLPGKEQESFSSAYPLPERFFAFEIQYVKSLFDKMDSLNKALIYLHEQLYLMGAPLGHLSSDDARYWVREFALLRIENIYESEQNKFLPPSDSIFDKHCVEQDLDFEKLHCFKPPRFLRGRMTDAFGDYALYFYQEIENKSGFDGENPFYKLFIESLLKTRKFLGDCIGESSASGIKKWCYDKFKETVITDEGTQGAENLLYLAWFIYGNQLELYNYEYLVVPNQNFEFALQWRTSLGYLCRQIKDTLAEFGSSQDPLAIKLRKAYSYCRDDLKLMND